MELEMFFILENHNVSYHHNVEKRKYRVADIIFLTSFSHRLFKIFYIINMHVM